MEDPVKIGWILKYEDGKGDSVDIYQLREHLQEKGFKLLSSVMTQTVYKGSGSVTLVRINCLHKEVYHFLILSHILLYCHFQF